MHGLVDVIILLTQIINFLATPKPQNFNKYFLISNLTFHKVA